METYTPYSVETGLRDMIVFDTGRVPLKVAVTPKKDGGYQVEVVMRPGDIEDREAFEEDIRYTLPKGYTPVFKYTEDEDDER